MSDLSYYYTPAPTGSNYVPTDLYTVDQTDLDERLDLLEAATSNLNAGLVDLNARYAAWSNIIYNVSNISHDDAIKWTDFLGPVTDVVGDFGSDLLKYYLDRLNWKEVFADQLKKLLNADPDVNVEVQDDDILATPDTIVDFRTLGSNVFAFDRTVGRIQKHFGCTVDRSLNLLSTSTLNVVDPGTLTSNSVYGVAFSPMMSSNALWTVMDCSNLSLRLNKGTFSNELNTSNFFCSNVGTCNITTNHIKVTDGAVDLLGGSLPAEIKSDGAARFYELNVNNNFIVRANGDVLVNGMLVITGAGRVVAYDDQVLPASSGYGLDDVLSGNIGADNTLDFCNLQPIYGDAETSTPLAFTDCENKNDATRVVNDPQMSATDAETISLAVSRATSASTEYMLPMPPSISSQISVDSMFDLVAKEYDQIMGDDEEDLFDIDIATGLVTNPASTGVAHLHAPPPVVAEPATLASRMSSLNRFLQEADPTNAEIPHYDMPHYTKATDYSKMLLQQYLDGGYSGELNTGMKQEAWNALLNVVENNLNSYVNHLGLTDNDLYMRLPVQDNLANIQGGLQLSYPSDDWAAQLAADLRTHWADELAAEPR